MLTLNSHLMTLTTRRFMAWQLADRNRLLLQLAYVQCAFRTGPKPLPIFTLVRMRSIRGRPVNPDKLPLRPKKWLKPFAN